MLVLCVGCRIRFVFSSVNGSLFSISDNNLLLFDRFVEERESARVSTTGVFLGLPRRLCTLTGNKSNHFIRTYLLILIVLSTKFCCNRQQNTILYIIKRDTGRLFCVSFNGKFWIFISESGVVFGVEVILNVGCVHKDVSAAAWERPGLICVGNV